ncbi:MAG TPA: CHAP domain-containing protein [Acidimicrobiales bacterium]|nr:CHAP domain-containing protein [Acidimicrobiales bacterium]
MTAAPVRARSHPKRRPRRWVGILLALCPLAGLAVGGYFATRPPDYWVLHFHGETVRVPKVPSLSPLRKRIVDIAVSQLGYVTEPPSTFCNKYSGYWVSGAGDCGNSNLAEEWCADFAAWVWEHAGADVTYQYINGDLNSSAASFYEWGAARGTWHPVGSRYKPLPGDVAVYGLDKAALVAVHVAVVIGYTPGERGPIAVNGDGDLTGFSVVEVATDELVADTHPGSAALSGYVSPS